MNQVFGADKKPRVDDESVKAAYQQEYEKRRDELAGLGSRWRTFAFLRGGLFLLTFVPLFLASQTVAGVNVPWLVLSGVIFLGFLGLAFVHERMSRRIRTSRLLVKMHKESLDRLDRDLSDVFAPKYEVPEAVLPVSFDLDLFGQQSLFRLLATPRTPFGVRILGDWIAHRADVDEIKARQIAVEELRDQNDWRTEFQLRCEQLASSQSGPTRFVEWAESECWVDKRRPILWFCRITALVSGLAILLLLFGVLPLTIAGPTLMVTVALNFAISVYCSGSIHEIMNQISSHQDEVSHYESLFSEVAAFKSESPFLRQVQDDLAGSGHDVRRHIKSLSFWNWMANLRRDGLFFIPYVVLALLGMWDIHILERLEIWKKANGQWVRQWFEALGRWETILALSKLAHDHPTWEFPSVKHEHPSVACEQLGHPLMDASRVSNDVTVGPAGTVLLVSGSNMSGKSTLLRSLGVNGVLAQMGSVVCAKSLSMPPLQIESSMRIIDSLATGTSFFMAELKRLKEIVDQAVDYNDRDEAVLFFLLDEILQGTNSAERQIAVARVVESLLQNNAIGAISTHDLELATTEKLKAAIVPVHFTEQFEEVDGKKEMTFDYRMRTGIAETTNALKLLEMVGLTG